MTSRLSRFAVCVLAVLPAISAALCRAQDTYPQDAQHFDHDKSAPLQVKELSVEQRGDVTIHDITYAAPEGTVPAYLVVPAGKGPFAAILWGHWLMPHAPSSNRKEFLEEAVALAPTGVVSLLIDAPQVRPEFQPPPSQGLGSVGAAILREQVIDLRRGADLLLARKDVDPKRLAYVGHSFDARPGPILDAVDKRFAAFVLMGGPYSSSDYALHADTPSMVAFRQKTPAATIATALAATRWADPGAYASHMGPAPVLFQFALHDDFTPPDFARSFAVMCSGPKEVKFYDTTHALNAEARADRVRFLDQQLRLTALPAGVLERVPPVQ